MVWVSIGVTLVALAVVIRFIGKRPSRDLGVVSANWIAQHRLDSSDY
jgi:hypothetical protein